MPNPAELWEQWKAIKNPWKKWSVLLFIVLAIAGIVIWRLVTFQPSNPTGPVKEVERHAKADLEATKKKDEELSRALDENAEARRLEQEKQKNEEAEAQKKREKVSGADSFDTINDAISDSANRRH